MLSDIVRTIQLLTTLLSFFTTGFSQTLCDTTNQKIWIVLEHPPQLTIADADLEIKLNSAIDPTLLANYNANFLYVTFFINCIGQDFNYELFKQADGLTKIDTISDFQKMFLSEFQSIASWTPGLFTFHKNGKEMQRPVDCQGSFTIRVDGNKLHILNEKEKQKHFKNKQKK